MGGKLLACGSFWLLAFSSKNQEYQPVRQRREMII
jgi:hypothetical protein